MPARPILAFDCSTHHASVALRVDGATYAKSIEHGKQAALLMPTIDELLKTHGVGYGDIGCMISTVGPGSFTGLRIALATLHGLVLAHPTPIKTLTSLEAVAWDITKRPDAPARFHVALDAGKGEVFTQAFECEGLTPKPQGDIAMIEPLKLDTTLPLFGNHLSSDGPHYIAGPSAEILCAIAEHLPESHIENALPMYIRPPDAKIPKQLPWLKEAV
jgi:tRNA threonylcarbamoyladenosine biosynthesis protein TsaB